MVWRIRKGSKSLIDCLAETWTKRWPAVSELEMPDVLEFMEKRYQVLKRLEC